MEKKKKYTEQRYPLYVKTDTVVKYTLRISMRYIKPSIWRKIEVPSNITLRYLSEILIYTIGWENIHLNHFRVGDLLYVPYYQRDDEFEGFECERRFNQEEYTIADILQEKGKHVFFDYDFGDSWEHEVKLSSIVEYADGESRAIKYIGGKRACPPEDCGGVWGYDELCGIITKPKSKLSNDEKEFLAYYDGYDPEYLDEEDLRNFFEKLK